MIDANLRSAARALSALICDRLDYGVGLVVDDFEDDMISLAVAFSELYELADRHGLTPSPATEASLYGDDAQAFLDDPEAACL